MSLSAINSSDWNQNIEWPQIYKLEWKKGLDQRRELDVDKWTI